MYIYIYRLIGFLKKKIMIIVMNFFFFFFFFFLISVNLLDLIIYLFEAIVYMATAIEASLRKLGHHLEKNIVEPYNNL